MKIKFQNIGWQSKISQKRSSFGITINKLVVHGSGLEKGQKLHCYLGEDSNKRVVMIVYLDGKKRNI